MELIVLGCASAYPSPTRGASAYILRHSSGECWLFDCGEGTQIELMRSEVRAGRIRRIFITHLHGDHLFGLPGLLCTLGQLGAILEPHERPVIEIYGPRGLRRFLREALRLSRSLLAFRFRVHELHFDEKEHRTCAPFAPDMLEPADWSAELEGCPPGVIPPHPNEMTDGAQNLWPNCDGRWTLLDATKGSDDMGVHAAWLPHTIPSFGFLIAEPPRAGKLDAAKAVQLGVPKGPLLGRLKAGHPVDIGQGDAKKTVLPSDVVGPAIPGRRLLLFGDTNDSTAAVSILCPSDDPVASRVDLVVHESTLEEALSTSAHLKGHSTPSQAAQAANACHAERLLLTHFSQRYDDTETAQLAEEARQHFKGDIVLALRGLKVRV